jgi:glucokinase
MTNPPAHVLLGDIGATNARFALLANGELGRVRTFIVDDFARFDDVVAAFLEDSADQIRATHALIAVAGPVEGAHSALTNCSWLIHAHELRKTFCLEARIVNDFEATGFSLPCLAAADLYVIGGGQATDGAPMAVLGPGTGLGVACLIPASNRSIVLASEGGHTTLAGGCDREDRILDHLRQRFGHVSAERALSGDGLENIYQAIATVEGINATPCDAAGITKSALEGGSQTAVAALETFCALLGSFAGSVALTFGARGGVYIAGGIAPRIVDFLARSEFRRRFEAKGRFQSYLGSVPTKVIVHPAATFVGLKSLVQRRPDPWT